MSPALPGRARGVYLIADDDPARRQGPHEAIEAGLAAGIGIVQLRLKHNSDRGALELCRWAAQRTREAGATLIVNDRFDLADLSEADGIHLGDQDLPPERIPRAVRERRLVGLSTHSLDQVRASGSRPIDYVAFGPVFGTTTKETEWDARGVDALAQAVLLAKYPLVAIGGITVQNIGQVAAVGAHAAAVISAIGDAEDPVTATRELRAAFDAGVA